MATQTLAEFLTEKLQLTSSRDLAAITGITHTTIQRMARGPLKNTPEIETLQRLARAFNFPLWRIMEMAGVDLELPDHYDTDMQRVLSLAKRQPAFGDIVSKLATVSPKDLDAVRQFLAVYGAQNRVYEVVHTLRREMPELAQALLEVGKTLGIPMHNQHVYEGERYEPPPQGRHAAEVKVDGEYLTDIIGWEEGIEWGYNGQGPRSLARAIFDYEFRWRSGFEAYRYSHYFYTDVIARLPREVGGREWALHSREIYLWTTLAVLAKRVPEEKPPVDGEADT